MYHTLLSYLYPYFHTSIFLYNSHHNLFTLVHYYLRNHILLFIQSFHSHILDYLLYFYNLLHILNLFHSYLNYHILLTIRSLLFHFHNIFYYSLLFYIQMYISHLFRYSLNYHILLTHFLLHLHTFTYMHSSNPSHIHNSLILPPFRFHNPVY